MRILRLIHMPQFRKSRIRWNALGGLLSLILILTFTHWYVSSEHTFYWEDLGNYQKISHELLVQSNISFASLLTALYHSFSNDYNALFAMPLVPILDIFGESRLVFEMGLQLFYMFPFTIMLALIAREIIPDHPDLAFWTTLVVALLTPVMWAPTLRGYPDVGAALLIALTIWVVLRDIKLTRLWQIPLVGFFLALAVLFRRHFAYAAIAFFIALILFAFIQRVTCLDRTSLVKCLRGFVIDSTKIILIGVIMGLTLVILGRPFVERTLTTNFMDLYSSFMRPWSAGMDFFVHSYGEGMWGGAIIGFAVGIYTATVNRYKALFVILFGSSIWLLWTVYVAEIDIQYSMHFTLAIVLGVAILIDTLWLRGKNAVRGFALGGIGIYLLLAMVVGLVPLFSDEWIGRSLFPIAWHPLVLEDYAELSRLVAFLKESAGSTAPIYVAASAYKDEKVLLNYDLIQTAERTLYGENRVELQVMAVPIIDSRDFYPIEMLMKAQYVLALTQKKREVKPGPGKDVVQVVDDLIQEQRYIGQDFVLMPNQFTLIGSSTVEVYKRIRPTNLQTAIDSFRYMQQNIRTKLGSQLDWIILNGSALDQVRKQGATTYAVEVSIPASDTTPATTLLHVDNVASQVSLSGQIIFQEQTCSQVTLQLLTMDAQDHTTLIAETTKSPPESSWFALNASKARGDFVLLNLISHQPDASAQPCRVRLEHLKLSPN